MSVTETEQPTESRSRGRRHGGRAGNQRRGGAAIHQTSWEIPFNTDRPTEPLPEEGILAIHNGAMRILEEVGVEFLNKEAVEIFRRNGCRIENETAESGLVKMDRAMVMETIAHAPSQFTITPRNKDREITIGGKHIVFGNISSPPNVS
ncbi:MAG: trimethylamine methyltransferase family protein, partial [Pseudomonadota bacterium]